MKLWNVTGAGVQDAERQEGSHTVCYSLKHIVLFFWILYISIAHYFRDSSSSLFIIDM